MNKKLIYIFLFVIFIFGLSQINLSQPIKNNEKNIKLLKNEKFSLSLGGGGGRGAYQIGMWKAFLEKGIFDNIEDISGTSVGALNAVLFAICSYDEAYNLWCNINPNTLLAFDINKENKGVFSREGLKDILETLPLEKLKKAKSVYINIYNVNEEKNQYIKLNDLSKEEIIKYLIAASALPVIYPTEKIDDTVYRDGGFGGLIQNGIYIYSENEPFEIHVKNNKKNVLIASLYHSFTKDNLCRADYTLVDFDKEYSNTNFIFIRPIKQFTPISTLDFTHKGIMKRINQGYHDTIKYLEKL